MTSTLFGPICIIVGWLLIYGIVWAGTPTAGGKAGTFPRIDDRWAVLTVAGLFILVVVFYLLWLAAGGHFATRDSGESHAVFLTAFNTRDFVTSILGDHVVSPDPEAHPYLYTHSPGLVPRYIAIALLHLGVGFEEQILIALVISAASLAIAFLALQRLFSSLYAAVFILATASSYWLFFYSAGDLYRAYTLLLIWIVLLVLSRNPHLARPAWNVAMAVATALVTATDWALAAFCLSFVAIWLTYENGRILWREIVCWVVLPSAVTLIAHQALVIHTFGRDFWLFDLVTTFFSRGGLEHGTREAEYLPRYREARVVVWHASGFVDAQDFVGNLVRVFFRSSGALGLVYLVAFPTMCVYAVSRRQWSGITILLVSVPIVLVLSSGVPFIALIISAIALALHIGLSRTTYENDLTRICTFGFLLLVAILIQSSVFPWNSFQQLLIGGKLPFGLLYSALFAISFVLIVASLSAHFGGRVAAERQYVASWTSFTSWLAGPANWLSIVAIAAIMIVATQRFTGFLVAWVIFSLGLAWSLSRWWNDYPALVRTGQKRILDLVRFCETRFGADVLRPSARLLAAGILVGIAMIIVYRTRAELPSGRRTLVVAALLVAGYGIGAGIQLGRAIQRLRRVAARIGAGMKARAGAHLPARSLRPLSAVRAVAAAFLVFLGLQITWSIVQGLRTPPSKPPYADILRKPPYVGASFLVWAPDYIVWLYTRGWTYTSETIPPDTSRPNLRWRHFADWRNESKYSRPQFFLCDQSRFRWDIIRLPGDPSGPTTTPPGGLQCKIPGRCTCDDVASEMVKQGHKIELSTPEYSIMRFVW